MISLTDTDVIAIAAVVLASMAAAAILTIYLRTSMK